MIFSNKYLVTYIRGVPTHGCIFYVKQQLILHDLHKNENYAKIYRGNLQQLTIRN
jgi:hypothetical protein